MNAPTWLSLVAMAAGVVLIVRAAASVTTKGAGRFRGDPFITLLLGFGLVLLGQHWLAG